MPYSRATAARTRPRDAHLAPEVLRARHLLLGLYGLLGLTVSSWLARLPSVRSALDLTTGQIGTILLVGALGSLMTVLVAGGAVARWGSRAVLTTAAVVFSVATVLMGLGPTLGSVAVLVAGIFGMSMSFALGNVPMNVEAAVVERRMGRTVVPQFHAAFSVGSVVGSLIGAATAWGQVPVLVQFSAVALVALVWRLLAIPGAVLPLARAVTHLPPGAPAPTRGAGLRTALSAWRERRTLLIGVVVMTAALSEGSANNWLAIAVVDGFAETEAVGALVFGVFVASMTVSRLAGTRLIDRFGRVPVLAGSGVVSLLGLALFGLAPSLPLAAVGVAAWGLGAGLAVPIGMAAASDDPLRAAGRVAVVSAFASVASISAPPVLGMVAEAVGIRQALLFICVGMVVSIVLSGRVQRLEEIDGRTLPDTLPEGLDAAAVTPSLPFEGTHPAELRREPAVAAR
ncbi:MFS transporter [Actinotalea sp. K2]|uniref:MFS transporter n=1 Tax=Actinotalea sp. K2 TaxID=2939438 RepID=UPI002017BB2A|nr:MFS transporter [Actinotalea sp. K2]MCL3860063.1 MFS transporter [Actinotalea sp. K2]